MSAIVDVIIPAPHCDAITRPRNQFLRGRSRLYSPLDRNLYRAFYNNKSSKSMHRSKKIYKPSPPTNHPYSWTDSGNLGPRRAAGVSGVDLPCTALRDD